MADEHTPHRLVVAGGDRGRLDDRGSDTSVRRQPVIHPSKTPAATSWWPGTRQFDLAAHKASVLREGLRLRFRAEACNAFNTPNFGALNAQVSDVAFGRIHSADRPRNLQFGVVLGAGMIQTPAPSRQLLQRYRTLTAFDSTPSTRTTSIPLRPAVRTRTR